jgi:hypothetical protein
MGKYDYMKRSGITPATGDEGPVPLSEEVRRAVAALRTGSDYGWREQISAVVSFLADELEPISFPALRP